ncbi:acyltransferase [Kineosporia sp. R_H_3]|uniref:acyltransferase family protein n=1 Tax=Kineosporia sp. R_H_3 TaxID=1961848 RepID=UPI001304158B|nr:acyltransferase [Kineosporia sp. R_H_3]
MARVKGFDGLRAIAVLAVLLFHIDLVGGGWIGVDLFFVLSGFLITTLLMREHARTRRIAIADFYVRRAARLYPALLVMVVACIPFAGYLGYKGDAEGYVVTAAVALTYLSDVAILVSGHAYGRLTHTWSLAVEEHFYLLWPLVVVLLRGRRRFVLAAALGGATLSFLATLLGSGRTVFDKGVPVAYFAPHTRVFELLLGAAAAALVFSRAGHGPGRQLDRLVGGRVGGVLRPAAPVLAPLGLLGLAAVMAYAGVVPRSEGFTLQLLAAGLTSCLLVLGVYLSQGSALVRALEWAPLAWLGTVSYGVYLFQSPIFKVAGHYFGAGPVTDLLVCVPLTIGAAALSSRYLESPVRDWARRRLTASAPHAPLPQQQGHTAAAAKVEVDAGSVR